jgi:ABC-type transport system involved in multi-copper enzyme maturation permease subunit
MATGNSMMQLEQGGGWTRGLRNVLRAEFGRWFGTRMWLSQILIWTALIDFVVLTAALASRQGDLIDSTFLFNVFMGLVGPIGTAIVLQEAILGEKRSGTAAWILSKPVARPAFLLSKLLANSTGIALTMIAVPGAIAYLISLLTSGQAPAPLAFVAGLGVHFVNAFFYLALAFMLGVLADSAAVVIGVPIAFAFVQQWLIGLHEILLKTFPWTLAIPLNGVDTPSVASAVMTGGKPLSYLPLITVPITAIIFLVVAFCVFARQEL